ncbi:lamin tail domain-containing protein [Streptomyces sp. NBC_00344]|uniref:lamin tail domain-containing protein n=1 Tax=Streptomyces sp. NBC_00344 TaxID=2975720 RepID=UPI002E24B459
MSRFATHLAATLVASSALLAAAALPAAAADHGRSAHRSPVVLGTIHSAGHIRSARALNTEWATVTNTGRNTVNLSGWTLSDADHHTYRFHHLLLGGHRSVRVHTGVGRDTGSNVYQDRRSSVWDSHDDTATLRDGRGHVVDSKSWGRRNEEGRTRHEGDNRHNERSHDRDGRQDGRDHDGRHDGRHDGSNHNRDGRHEGRGHDRDGQHERRDHDGRHDGSNHNRDGQHDGGHDGRGPGQDGHGHR